MFVLPRDICDKALMPRRCALYGGWERYRSNKPHAPGPQIRRPIGSSRPLQNCVACVQILHIAYPDSRIHWRRVQLDRFFVFRTLADRDPLSLSRARARGFTGVRGTAGLCFATRPADFGFQKIFCKERKTFPEPSEKASLDLGSLTHSRRFAQCAPTHRETTQNGVTS